MSETTTRQEGDIDALAGLFGDVPGSTDVSDVIEADPPQDDPATPETEQEVPVTDGETDSENDANPETEGDEPVAEDDAAAEKPKETAENPFSSLDADETEALLATLNEYLSNQGKEPVEEAPVQPEEAAVQQAQEQQPQQPVQPFAGIPDFDDDDLMDTGRFNQKLRHRDAAISSIVAQQTAQSMLPVVAMVAEATVATLLAETNYPELKGKTGELGALIRAERERDHTADTHEIVDRVAKRFMTNEKAKNALAKLAAGKGGVRVINAPSGRPAGLSGAKQAAASAQPAPKKMSPHEQLLNDLKKHKEALGYK